MHHAPGSLSLLSLSEKPKRLIHYTKLSGGSFSPGHLTPHLQHVIQFYVKFNVTLQFFICENPQCPVPQTQSACIRAEHHIQSTISPMSCMYCEVVTLHN